MQTLADAPPFYVSESAALREMRTSQKPSGSLPFLVERSSQPTCPVRFCSSSRPGVCPPSAVALAIRKSGSGIAQTSVSTLPRRWCCNDVSLRASGFKTESREGLGRGGRRGAPDGCGSSNIRTSVICGYEPGVPPEAGHTGLNPHQTVRHGSAVVENFLKLGSASAALSGCQVCLSASVLSNSRRHSESSARML